MFSTQLSSPQGRVFDKRRVSAAQEFVDEVCWDTFVLAKSNQADTCFDITTSGAAVSPKVELSLEANDGHLTVVLSNRVKCVCTFNPIINLLCISNECSCRKALRKPFVDCIN